MPIYPPLKAQKIKIFKKIIKGLEISFYTSVPKILIICYIVPELWHVMDVIAIFHFGLFFALLPPARTTQKNKIFKKKKKKKKKKWKYHCLTHVYQKLRSDNVRFLRYGVQQTDRCMDRCMDRQTDGQTEKLTYKGACTT